MKNFNYINYNLFKNMFSKLIFVFLMFFFFFNYALATINNELSTQPKNDISTPSQDAADITREVNIGTENNQPASSTNLSSTDSSIKIDAPVTINNNNCYMSLMAKPLVISDDDKVYGNRNAKVVLIEYSSPTCRHCAYYHKAVLPEIKKKYIDTNKIAYVIRMFITNKLDLDAGVIPYCINDEQKFFTLVEDILGCQDKWISRDNYLSSLTIIANIAGISKEQYQICLKDEKITRILLENNRAALSNPKFRAIPGTPAFFINGVKFEEAYSIEKLSIALDNAIKANQ